MPISGMPARDAGGRASVVSTTFPKEAADSARQASRQ
jgi:hypothetical protein